MQEEGLQIRKKIGVQITDVSLTKRSIGGIIDRVVRQELRKIVIEQSTLQFQQF